MSLATVMKNVYTFAQILGQASGNTARLWDIQAVENALKWASYCEQIYQHVKDKRIASALDQKLLDMTIMLEPSSSVCLSVDVLGQAMELLKKTLLENPRTSMEVISKLVAERKSAESVVMQHLSEMISKKSVRDLPDEVLSFLDSETDLTELDNLRRLDKLRSLNRESPVVTAQASLVLHHLINLLQSHTPDTVISRVEHILERTSCLQHGWEILVCMMYLPLNLTNTWETSREVRDLVVRWMSERQDSYLNLWHVPHFMLNKAATSGEKGCQLFLDVMTWLTNQMTVDYHQLTNGRLYSWRYQSDKTSVVLDDLVDSCQSLINYGGDTRRLTVTFLMDKAQASYFNIWRDVCRKLH